MERYPKLPAEEKTMRRKIEEVIWFLVENLPSLLTVAFAAYVLIQSQRATLQVMEVLLWLLGIVGLLATSELVERFRHLKRIEDTSLRTLNAIQAMAIPDAENILKDRQAVIDNIRKANRAKEIWMCGYSLVHLVRAHEGFFLERLKDGCNLRFLLLKPGCDVTHMLDRLMTPKPGQLIGDIDAVLACLRRIRASADSATSGQVEIRLLKTVPTFSLIIVDPGQPNGWVQVGPYPSYHNVPLDTGRPQLFLNRSEGRWYKFFCDQFQRLWNDPRYSEPYKAEASSSTSEGKAGNFG
jgi:hypothetical protein